MLSGLVEWATGALERAGLLGLFLVLVAENLFPPIPSEAVLPLAGFLVGEGRFGFLGAWLAATGGAVAGALILYALGRFGGRPLIYRFHWLLRIAPADLDRADAWFDRRGAALIVFGRLIPLVRSVVSVPAGMSEMPVWKFLALTVLGTGAWNAALIGGGIALGERYEQLGDSVDALTWPLLGLGVAMIAAYIALTWRRQRRPGRGGAA